MGEDWRAGCSVEVRVPASSANDRIDATFFICGSLIKPFPESDWMHESRQMIRAAGYFL